MNKNENSLNNGLKEQFESALELCKNIDIDGCITGSSLLGYYNDENNPQDIDIFAYSEKSFTKLYYYLYYHPMFSINDKLEQWKAEDFMNRDSDYYKKGILTIKMLYNTCINVNIVLKKGSNNIFSVISLFDMNIICKGYDLKTKQILDLTDGSTITRIADVNKWNTTFYDPTIWNVSKLLRQFTRNIKYSRNPRNINTDNVTKKYREILIELQEYDNIFNSDKVDVKIETVRENTKILLLIIDKWLETHVMSLEEEKLLNETLRKL